MCFFFVLKDLKHNRLQGEKRGGGAINYDDDEDYDDDDDDDDDDNNWPTVGGGLEKK